MDHIKAVRYHAPGDVRVENIPMPECSDSELLVKVDACAVCGSDMKAFLVGNPRIKPPMTMGHEFTGIIETIGGNVSGFSAGERIVMATSVSCGECFYCNKGWNNLCSDLKPMGFSYPGGMAEYVTIPETALRNGHVIKVPDNIKARHAALAEPVSCGVNSCEQCNIQKSDTVLVMGAGPMGIINAIVARELGASKIIMSEINDFRLKQCDQFGFDLLINPGKDDLEKAVMEATDGIGADVAIVAAPAALPQEQALALVRKRGTVCLFASLPAGKNMLNMDSRLIHYKEIRVVGTSDSTPAHVKKAVELLSNGTFPADKLASHSMNLDDIHKAFELMKSGETLRVVLTP